MSLEIPSDALRKLQSGIHYEFRQVKLLIQALTHTSHANEHGGCHNERLEFLGDAVLELTVSHELYLMFPDAEEGHLTRMRSAMVSETALAAVARRLCLGYCLQFTLKQRAKAKAPGLTPRAILEKFKSMQMIDVHLPTTDGRNLILPRYTQPEKELKLLLHQLNLTLPDQPPPRLEELQKKCSEDL